MLGAIMLGIMPIIGIILGIMALGIIMFGIMESIIGIILGIMVGILDSFGAVQGSSRRSALLINYSASIGLTKSGAPL